MIIMLAIYSHGLTADIDIKRNVMKVHQILLGFIFFWSHHLWAEGGGAEKVTEVQTPPYIKVEKGMYELIESEAITAALQTAYPDFVAWKTTDYSPSLVQGLLQDGAHSAPFAFVMDINQDNIKDLVIDGVIGNKTALLAVLSSPEEGYRVVSIAPPQKMTDPQKINSMVDGEVEQGLSYLLWPNSNPHRATDLIFTLAFPQETNEQGELLSDGGVMDYHFKDGRFVAMPPEF